AIADLLVELLVVRVEAHVAAMVHDNEQAHPGQPVRVRDTAAQKRLPRGAARRLDHAAVPLEAAAARLPEPRRELAVHWPGEPAAHFLEGLPAGRRQLAHGATQVGYQLLERGGLALQLRDRVAARLDLRVHGAERFA